VKILHLRVSDEKVNDLMAELLLVWQFSTDRMHFKSDVLR